MTLFRLTECVCVCVFEVSAWGGYVFIINLIPLHVFVLLLMRRFSKRVYIGESQSRFTAESELWFIPALILIGHLCLSLSLSAYSTFYIIGLILSMQIPFVGFQPIRTSEHMAAAGESLLIGYRVTNTLIQCWYNVDSLCVCRCVRARAALHVPAVPERQNDAAGQTDSVFCLRLCCCANAVCVCRLPQWHRSVYRGIWSFDIFDEMSVY